MGARRLLSVLDLSIMSLMSVQTAIAAQPGGRCCKKPANREEIQRWGRQLGACGREDTNLPSVGFLATSLRYDFCTGVVPRHLLPRWQTVPRI
jgi:hypothetical protein